MSVYYKIIKLYDKCYYVPEEDLRSIYWDLEQMEIDEIFMIKKVEMKKEEIEKLPEFQGW